MISRQLAAAFSRVDPERRRAWAARILVGSLGGWVASHVVLQVLDQGSFFNHVLNAISWWAVSLTCADILSTADVKVDVAGDAS